MTEPWQGDACSLIDSFRAGERSPLEELEATLSAIGASRLNAFCHLDADAARANVAGADVSAPLGGLPVGVKELDPVEGWPLSEASLVFSDRVSTHDATVISRLRAAGAVLTGQTTASEFGGLNVSVTLLHGVTGNPWDRTKTTGGSSAGSAAAVAGGLVPLATGGDGGGSIRIPAGFCGLVGMKGTAGRIPRGPRTAIAPLTVVFGCLARSVRDVARYYDVATGFDSRDPYSLPRVERWERDLGSRDLRGKRVAIAASLGSAIVRPEVEELVVRQLGRTALFAGAMANMASLIVELGDRYPDCLPEMTQEMAFGLKLAAQVYNLDMAAQVERNRTEANETMADVFDQVDFVVSATNPDVAFPAHVGLNTKVGELTVGPENNGALTIPANVSGNPAISIPAGLVDGLPVGMQVMAPHHADALLLDLALLFERERPWPLVAPGAPC